jgi:hypothetical protein
MMILGVSRIIRAMTRRGRNNEIGKQVYIIHWSMNIDRIAGYLVRLMNFITSIPSRQDKSSNQLPEML